MSLVSQKDQRLKPREELQEESVFKMQEIWFNGAKPSDKEAREKVKQDIGLARNAFERLTGILSSRMKDSAVKDYNKAAWPFLQADTNGYNRALTEVLKLIKETD